MSFEDDLRPDGRPNDVFTPENIEKQVIPRFKVHEIAYETRI